MKNFKQLVKELPAKKIVFAFGRYQPPTIGHGLLVAAVKKVAEKQGADHIIYASRTQDKKSNPLPVDRKVYYLKRMFPGTNFVAANDHVRTFIEAVKELNKKYKNLVMIAGSDRVPEYKKILDKYNGKDFHYDTIEVVSAGERDPDSDSAAGMSGTKMREAAKKGDFAAFKKGLPSTLTTQDAKRLMNELREAMGVEAIKEQVTFTTDELREQYHKGEIYNVGEKVQDDNGVYEIVDRGANYITVVNESGEMSKKWIHTVTYAQQVTEDIQPGPAPEEISFKGYTTKNLHHSADATKAFQATIDRMNKGLIHNDPVAVLNALKATDTYMKLNDMHLEQGKAPDEAELKTWREAHTKARDALLRIGEFMHHEDYWHMHQHELEGMEAKYTPETVGDELVDSYEQEGQLVEMKFSPADKIKVARVIASALGLADVEKSSSPEQLINNALRKVRAKPMRPEYIEVLNKMLHTAREAGIMFDDKLVPQKAQDVTEAAQPYWKKASFIKRMADAAKRERLAREKKEKEQQQVKEGLGGGREDDEGAGRGKNPRKDFFNDRPHTVHVNGKPWKKFSNGAQAKKAADTLNAQGKKAIAIAHFKEEEELDEAVKLGSKVKIHAPGKDYHGEVGHVGEIRHGAYKGAPKTYTVDYGDRKSIQLGKERIKLHKEHTDVIAELLEALATANMLGKQDDVADIKKKLSIARNLKDDDKENESDIESQVDPMNAAPAIGHSITAPGENRTVRKMKVSYATEALDPEQEKAAKETEKASLAAKQATEKEALAKKQANERERLKEEDEKNEAEEPEEKDEEIADSELDDMASEINDIDDVIDAYDDSELAVVDDESGEEVESDEEENKVDEEALMEVLSRAERIRAKIRFAQSKAKRERKVRIALKSRSSTATINNRARRLAVQLMKKRIAKKPLDKMSVSEKERVEKIIQRRKTAINRLAMKLVPRVKKIESDRLTHKKYTKG